MQTRHCTLQPIRVSFYSPTVLALDIRRLGLAALAGVATFVLGAPAALADTLSATPSPSEPIEETPFQVTVSGDEPEGVLLVYVLASSAPSCPASGWEAARGSTHLTPEGGESVAGAFTKTYSIAGIKGGQYEVCAYIEVGEPSLSSTRAATRTAFDVRAALASISINTRPANILAGRPIAIEVTGTAEVAATLVGHVYGGGECYGGTEGSTISAAETNDNEPICASAFGAPVRVGPGAFDVHLSYIPTDNGPDDLWFTVARLGPPEYRYWMGQAHVTLSTAPLPAPEPLSPADGWRTLPGPMTFSWSAAPFGEDTLIVYDKSLGAINARSETEGEVEYEITAKGFREYVEGTPENKWTALRKLGTWTSNPPTGDTSFQLKQGLGPGEYTWEVRRGNGSEKTVSPKRSFTVYTAPATILKVKPRSHPGITSRHPGYTEVVVTTNPWMNVALTLRHGHHRNRPPLGENASKTFVAAIIQWSCAKPAGTYHYVVTARGDTGRALTRTGRFGTITTGRCAAMERQEAEERAHRDREAAQRAREAERKEREAHEQWEANCQALGGTVVTLHTSEGAERACRSQRGGLLPVPE